MQNKTYNLNSTLDTKFFRSLMADEHKLRNNIEKRKSYSTEKKTITKYLL